MFFMKKWDEGHVGHLQAGVGPPLCLRPSHAREIGFRLSIGFPITLPLNEQDVSHL